MISDSERREVAARFRALDYSDLQESLICAYLDALGIKGYTDWVGIAHCLAELIEPSRKPDADYDRWYNSLVGWAVNRDEPATIREIIKEIIWITLTADLGPNGNTDPSTGIDEGMVYTNGLIDEWELAIKRLCGNYDRDALLALADEMEQETGSVCGVCMGKSARRIRKALGVEK